MVKSIILNGEGILYNKEDIIGNPILSLTSDKSSVQKNITTTLTSTLSESSNGIEGENVGIYQEYDPSIKATSSNLEVRRNQSIDIIGQIIDSYDDSNAKTKGISVKLYRENYYGTIEISVSLNQEVMYIDDIDSLLDWGDVTPEIQYTITGPEFQNPFVIYYEDFTNGVYTLSNVVEGEYNILLEAPLEVYPEEGGEYSEAYLSENTQQSIDITVLGNKISYVESDIYYNVFPIEFMDIPIVIYWDDNDNIRNRRASEITVHLYADGINVNDRQLNEENNWEDTFFEVPIFSDEGTKITYTITSSTIENYTQNIDYDVIEDGVVITYTYHPPEVTKTIQIVWSDASTPKPPTVNVKFLENNQIIETYGLKENSSPPWSISISGLDANNNYDAIFPQINGYTITKSISGNVITGSYEVEPEDPDKPPK